MPPTSTPRSTRRQKTPITVEHLWKMARIGGISLAPDGAQAVSSVATYSMEENKARSTLWLFSTLGGAPRALTHAGEKDGQAVFSPQGDYIAFVSQREQEGRKDETPQLYLIAPDGGEARRMGHVPTGVGGIRWFPDGRRIAFISWVWPGLKGAGAQAKAHKTFTQRKETGYATSEHVYRYWDSNLPMERVPHLCVMDLSNGQVRDLFEGTSYELPRTDPDAQCYDISPDGRRIVFAHDPAGTKRIDGRFALAEVNLRGGRITPLARHAEWDFGAPRYSPDGAQVAFIASHQGRKHTMPGQLAVTTGTRAGWKVLSAEWDHDVRGPLRWRGDGEAIYLMAEDKGRCHVWCHDLASRQFTVAVRGGTVSSYDEAAGALVAVHDAANHPGQAWVHAGGEPVRRMERFNDDILASLDIGTHEERWFTGALGDQVQMWLFYPAGFSAKKRYPLLQVIHGGPHTAPGDGWHYRWNNPTFAAQGYVVACVNYHGSSSFGHAFLDSITHRWGELELQDVEAATTVLLKEPWADKRRVFAAGGSYGGYMVAWMNGHSKPGRYQAYVCHAGCFDWTAMFADDAYGWHAKELGAFYWDDMARVHAQSPHAFAKNFSTPTLVVHGTRDYRVPDTQGLAYYNTLKAQDVPARLLWYPDENHWILKPRNSRQWYGEFFSWLRAHDPGPVKKGPGRR